MSSSSIEKYTDKELENAIKLHETELRKNKNDFVNRKKDQSALEIKQLQQVIMQEEDWLRRLYKERKRRKSFNDVSIV
jgi:hypothetical protein